MAAQNGNGSRREIALWSIGAALGTALASWTSMVQLVVEPLERDVNALSRRVDEAVLASVQARNELREELRVAVADSLGRGEERRAAMVTQQDQINRAYGSALGDMAARINRIEQDRARLIEEAIGRLQRIEDHLNALDARVVNIEDNFTHVLRGDAIKPDRFGGPPYSGP